MKPWLHKIEVFVDKIIPLLLVILLAIIIGEFGYHEFMEEHRLIVEIIDGFIIFIFVLDLIFKYIRIRNIPKFLRASWIDILAVFPFFLFFRLFGGLFGLFEVGETLTRAQKVVHVGVEIEKEIGAVVKEGEIIAKEASRAERLTKMVRPIARSFRLFKFGNPKVQRETEKNVQIVGKTTQIVIKQTEKGAEALVKDISKTIKETGKVPRYVKAAIFYEKPKIMKYVVEKLNKQKKEVKRR